ncbi:MAG: ABC transporter permease [Anaerolineales bacterium]
MNARTILAIAWKDILDAIKNRYLLMSLILPIGLSLLFQLIFGGIANTGKFRVAVFNPGGSQLTAQFRNLETIDLVEVKSLAELKKEVTGDSVGGIIIPANFDADVALGNQPELTIYLNVRKGGGELAVFRDILYQQVWTMREGDAPVRLIWTQSAVPEDSIPDSGIRKEGFRMDFYLLVMFLVMSLTMTGSFVVPLLLVEEKEKHTMEFLLVAPVTPAEIAAGKAVTGLAYSLLSATVLLLLNKGLSGNWPVTLLAVVLGALFLVMAGLLMGTLLNTMMQINTWSTIIMMILLAPSWLSVLQPPALIDKIIHLIPTFYLVELLSQSLTGAVTFSDAAWRLGLIAASTLVMFGIVIWVMRRQEA